MHAEGKQARQLSVAEMKQVYRAMCGVEQGQSLPTNLTFDAFFEGLLALRREQRRFPMGGQFRQALLATFR